MPERSEDVFFDEICEGEAAHALHNQAEQDVVGIDVLVIGAGGEVEAALRRQHPEIAGNIQNLRRAACRFKQWKNIAQSAGVMEQVGDSHVLHQRRQFRNVAANRVLQPHLSGIVQEKERRGGELLADGGHVERRRGRDRRRCVEICKSERVAVYELAVLDCADRAAGSGIAYEKA